MVLNSQKDLESLLTNLQKLVVQGQHLQAKQIIEKMNMRQVPRASAADFADIAWRIGAPLFALKILFPIVFPKNHLNAHASDNEKMIYASALINLGATQKALEMFDLVDSKSNPEVLLRKALAQFTFWNYQEGTNLLLSFVENKEISEYKRLVGEINLAAAHICLSNWDLATNLLEKIQAVCIQNSYSLLLGNSYELAAQIKIFNAEFDAAIPLLAQAREHLKDQQGGFLLYVEKWEIICRCFKTKSPEGLQKLRDLKILADSLLQWETIRECDLFEAIITQNDELIKKVVVGTPYENYRVRVRNLYSKKIVPQGKYFLDLGTGPTTETFSPYDKLESGEALFNKPQLLALYEALTCDFYRPHHLGLLFQKIYPDEKFNPFNSPDRVLQLLRRLDQWFLENKVSLRIRMKKSEFLIQATEGKTVRVLVSRSKKLSKENAHHLQLKTLFKGRTFSAQHVAEKMNISRRSANTFINQELDLGHVVQVGTGRSTLYQIKQSKSRKSAA